MKKTAIAIFEDNKVNSFIHAELLNHISTPMDCFVFNDVEKGLDKAREVQFDIVFIEIHFRGSNLSGIEILKELNRIQKEKFISIGMASLIQAGDRELILSSGFTMLIEKPLVLKEINSLLNL